MSNYFKNNKPFRNIVKKSKKTDSDSYTAEDMERELDAAEKFLKHRDPWDEIKVKK